MRAAPMPPDDGCPEEVCRRRSTSGSAPRARRLAPHVRPRRGVRPRGCGARHYPGRTTHVHFKVHVGARSEATSQIYFPEETTAAVYAAPPYAARGPKDTSNAADGVVRFEGAPPLARVSRAPSGGLLATLVVGVAT